jgi:hypothetical protein
MKTILKDYIGYFETPNSAGQISYLKPEIISKSNHEENSWGSETGSNEFSSYPEMGLTVNSLLVQTEEHHVSSIIDPEMASDIQSFHGIDMSTMIKSTLENEMEIMTEKKILKSMEDEADRNWMLEWTKFQALANKWFGYEPKMTWNSPRDFARRISLLGNKMMSENRTGGQIFIITNSRIAAEMQDLPEFIYDGAGEAISISSGIFPAGNLFGIKILVTPYLSFSEDKILIGIKPSQATNARIFMVENPEDSFAVLVSPDTLGTKSILTRRFGIKTVPSKNYTILKIAEGGKKHNLLTHILSRTFKK